MYLFKKGKGRSLLTALSLSVFILKKIPRRRSLGGGGITFYYSSGIRYSPFSLKP